MIDPTQSEFPLSRRHTLTRGHISEETEGHFNIDQGVLISGRLRALQLITEQKAGGGHFRS